MKFSAVLGLIKRKTTLSVGGWQMDETPYDPQIAHKTTYLQQQLIGFIVQILVQKLVWVIVSI